MKRFTLKTHVAILSFLSLPNPNGQIVLKYITTTASIAPSWITTSNNSKKCSDTFSFINSSNRIKCPVDDIGNHSVIPSTIPKNIAFIISIISLLLYSILFLFY